MSMGGHILSGPAKVWLYPTIGLCVVGAPALAAGWSQVVSTGFGMGIGIAVEDAPNIGTSFQQGQREAGGTATTGAEDEAAEGTG